MQKFWKSVKIWQSYREFEGGNFFETQCRVWGPFIHLYSFISLYDTPQQIMIQATLLKIKERNRKESISSTTKLSRCLEIIWHISTCLWITEQKSTARPQFSADSSNGQFSTCCESHIYPHTTVLSVIIFDITSSEARGVVEDPIPLVSRMLYCIYCETPTTECCFCLVQNLLNFTIC